MNDMTGGTLPAMTWQEVMAFAHQNLEIRPIPGVEPGQCQPRRLRRARPDADPAQAPRPGLSRRHALPPVL